MQVDCLSSPGPWEKSCIGYLHLFLNVLLQLYALEAQVYQKCKKKNKMVKIQFFSLFGGYFSTKWAQLSFFYHILGLLTCLSITLSSPMKKVCQIQFSYSHGFGCDELTIFVMDNLLLFRGIWQDDTRPNVFRCDKAPLWLAVSVGWLVGRVTHSFDDPHVAPYWPTWSCWPYNTQKSPYSKNVTYFSFAIPK